MKPQEHHAEPRRLRHLDRGDEQKADDHHEARGHQHQERDHPVLQKASLLLDAPRFIHSARDGAKDAERGPNQREAAGDANLQARLPKRVELRGDEIETGREIAEDKGQDGQPLILARGDRTEQRDDQEEKRKEREQRVVGN